MQDKQSFRDPKSIIGLSFQQLSDWGIREAQTPWFIQTSWLDLLDLADPSNLVEIFDLLDLVDLSNIKIFLTSWTF